jgi:uncharacterized protein YjeT (DUF2065 family)
MTMPPKRSAEDAAEALARQRFMILNAIRFSGLGLVLLGIVIARKVLPFDVPWAVGAVLALAGLLEFFFLPRMVARSWKAGDDRRP